MSKNKQEYPKLPQEFKDKLINSLRYGSFKKINEEMASVQNNGEYGYCVLGLVGHLCGVPDEALRKYAGPFELEKKYRDLYPKELLNSKLAEKLVSLNDGGYGKKRLADWIEKNI